MLRSMSGQSIHGRSMGMHEQASCLYSVAKKKGSASADEVPTNT